MKSHIGLLFLVLSFWGFPQVAFSEASPNKLKALYNSLDPTSISQHLAFYELYSQTPEGQQALREAYRLLTGDRAFNAYNTPLPSSLTTSINAIVGLVNKHPSDSSLLLNGDELILIEKLATRLPHRGLKGHAVTSEEEVIQLPSDQIDLARGLLLSQLSHEPNPLPKVRSYEAMIDLMALQILARVSLHDTPKAKIRAMNHFIFEEMGFRFPPHSTYAKDIDLYTFLPSVLDSRRGVCLGVSILYICLAQRLNLNLEIVIPPGHIFVRWRQVNEIINIETTARGIHLPDEEYLGIDLRYLPQCDIKETIGMAHYNQASVYWERQEYDKAMAAYQKAWPYMPNHKLMTALMGFTAILQGNEEKGREYLKQIVDYLPDHAVSKDTFAEDYLNGFIDRDGIQANFMHVDETRESLLKKRQALEESLKKYPKFREGIFSLAGTWLQLHRAGEALQTLIRYHEIDPTNPTVEYYLSALYAERSDFNKAWEHLRLAEKLTHARQHNPEALTDLRQELYKLCPE